MKLKRCHSCGFLKHKTRCYFLSAKDRSENNKYHYVKEGDVCQMTGKVIERLIEPVKEPEIVPKTDLEIRRENLIIFKEQLAARRKELLG